MVRRHYDPNSITCFKQKHQALLLQADEEKSRTKLHTFAIRRNEGRGGWERVNSILEASTLLPYSSQPSQNTHMMLSRKIAPGITQSSQGDRRTSSSFTNEMGQIVPSIITRPTSAHRCSILTRQYSEKLRSSCKEGE
jgi:hypothetical protein